MTKEEWEDKREGCPLREINARKEYVCMGAVGHCTYETCPFVYWEKKNLTV